MKSERPAGTPTGRGKPQQAGTGKLVSLKGGIMNRKEMTDAILAHFKGTGLKLSRHKAERIGDKFRAELLKRSNKDSDLEGDLRNLLNYLDPTGNQVVRNAA